MRPIETFSRPMTEKIGEFIVHLEVLEAISQGRNTTAEIANRVGVTQRMVRRALSSLSTLGIISNGQDGAFRLTPKGEETLASMRSLAKATMREQAQRKDVRCSFCDKQISKEYFFVCHICGERFCYIHMYRHARAHSSPEIEAKYNKLVLLVRAPRTLDEAFGVDGRSAREVAEMISRQRRDEVAK